MVKAVKFLCCAFLIVGLLGFSCLADSEIGVSYDEYDTKDNWFFQSGASFTTDIASVFSPATTVYGSPVGWLYRFWGNSLDYNGKVYFTVNADYDYLIVPYYNFNFTITGGAVGGGSGGYIKYLSADAISAGDYEVVDSVDSEEFSTDITTYQYGFQLLRARHNSTSSTVVFNAVVSGMYDPANTNVLALPFYAPKAFKSSGGGGSDTSSGGGGVNPSSGTSSGGGGSCPEWSELVSKVDYMNQYLNSISWQLDSFEKKMFDENYESYKRQQMHDKVTEASMLIQSVVDGMSFPKMQPDYNKPTLSATSEIGGIMDRVGRWWFLTPILTCAVPLWVVSLILYGKKNNS